MGGLNFEMLLAEGIEERAVSSTTSTGMLAVYASSKLAAREYGLGTGVLNDISNILDFYQGTGVDATYDDVRSGSLVALFGSGLFYEFGHSFTGADGRLAALRVAGFSLPNTSYYLNEEGPWQPTWDRFHGRSRRRLSGTRGDLGHSGVRTHRSPQPGRSPGDRPPPGRKGERVVCGPSSGHASPSGVVGDWAWVALSATTVTAPGAVPIIIPVLTSQPGRAT